MDKRMRTTFHPPPHVAQTLIGPPAGRAARLALKQLLASFPVLDWHADAGLAMSELVANAISECGECRLSLWYAGDVHVLRVEVADTSANMPVPQPFDSTRVGGHGLRIVESVSTRWGVIATEHGGKVVWLEMDG
jgi:hypothetical protein